MIMHSIHPSGLIHCGLFIHRNLAMDDIADEHEHIDPSLVYVPINIPGKGCPPEFFEEFSHRCTCQDDPPCRKNCRCSPQDDQYNEEGRLEDLSCQLVFECRPGCGCGWRCCNRVVQRGPLKHLNIFDTEHKGQGLRVKEPVSKGTFVCTYSGEILSKEEGLARNHKDGTRSGSNNYLLFVNEDYQSTQVAFAVDPTVVGNIGRYINHSCDPNLIMIPVRVDSMIPHLGFFARHDIVAGVELTFNYGNPAMTDKKVAIGNTECRCQSFKCNGYLPYQPKL